MRLSGMAPDRLLSRPLAAGRSILGLCDLGASKARPATQRSQRQRQRRRQNPACSRDGVLQTGYCVAKLQDMPSTPWSRHLQQYNTVEDLSAGHLLARPVSAPSLQWSVIQIFVQHVSGSECVKRRGSSNASFGGYLNMIGQPGT